MIGIPYAMADFDVDGTLVRICPECSLRCREGSDATGEQTTTTYADHYDAAHGQSADTSA